MAGTKEVGVCIECGSGQQRWLQIRGKQGAECWWMHQNVVVSRSDETKSMTEKQDVFATFVRVLAIA